MTTHTLQVLLLLVILALYVLALFYLRRRGLNPARFAIWALLALFVPILGPFIVFAAQPGSRDSRLVDTRARNRRGSE
jgi:membrane-bound metal-dependent hydrolase YbcI (DUF457 family)